MKNLVLNVQTFLFWVWIFFNVFLKLEKTAAKVGLQCNEGKTVYM